MMGLGFTTVLRPCHCFHPVVAASSIPKVVARFHQSTTLRVLHDGTNAASLRLRKYNFSFPEQHTSNVENLLNLNTPLRDQLLIIASSHNALVFATQITTLGSYLTFSFDCLTLWDLVSFTSSEVHRRGLLWQMLDAPIARRRQPTTRELEHSAGERTLQPEPRHGVARKRHTHSQRRTTKGRSKETTGLFFSPVAWPLAWQTAHALGTFAVRVGCKCTELLRTSTNSQLFSIQSLRKLYACA